VLPLHALLKLREARDSVLERDDLAVRNEGVRFLPVERGRDLRIRSVQKLSISRAESQVASVVEHEAAFPIELRLKEPAFLRRALVDEHREHRCYPAGLWCLSKPGSGFRGQTIERIPAGRESCGCSLERVERLLRFGSMDHIISLPCR